MTNVVKTGLFGLSLLFLSLPTRVAGAEIAEIQTGKAQDILVSTAARAEPVLALGRPIVTGTRDLGAPGRDLVAVGDNIVILTGKQLLMSVASEAFSGAVDVALTLPSAADHIVSFGGMIYAVGPDVLYVIERSSGGLRLRGRAALEVGARAVAAENGKVYLLRADNRLQVVDATNPDAPRALESQPLSVIARALQVRDGVLYLAVSGDGLATFAIDDGGTLKPLGHARIGCDAVDLAVADGLVHLACGEQGVTIYSVEDPSDPRWLGSHQEVGFVGRIALQEDRLYALGENGALSVLDVGHAALPSIVSTTRLAETPVALLPEGPSVLLLSGQEIRRLDTDVRPPVISNEGLDFGQGVNLGGQRRAEIRDGKLYVADWFSGVHIYDIANPASPHLISSVHTPGSPKGIILRGDLAYVADDDHGLEVIDIQDPQQPEIIDRLQTEGLGYTPVIVGDRLYLASHRGGFQVIDISEPRKPKLLSTTDTEGKAWSIRVRDNIAYIADDDDGLLFFDVSDAGKPRQIGQFSPGGAAEEVLLDGDKAYVSFFEGGLYVLDISDPKAPKQIGHIELPGNARGLELVGKRLYVACWLAGVQVVDVSDPTAPRHLTGYDTHGAAWGIRVHEGHGYVLDWWGGLSVLDLSRPDRMTALGRYPHPGLVEDSAMQGDYAYVAQGHAGLQVFDIRNTLNPTWVTGVDVPDARQVITDDKQAYVLDGPHRILVLDIGDPFSTHIRQHYLVGGDVAFMRFRNGRLYLLDNDGAVTIMNPADGKIAALEGIGDVIDIDVESGALATLSRSEGVKVFRLTDPDKPEQVQTYADAKSADLVRMLDGRAFVHRPGVGLIPLASVQQDGKTTAAKPLIELPEGVRDVQGESGQLFALLGDGRVVQMDTMFQPWRPVVVYAPRQKVTSMRFYNGVLYLSGAQNLIAIRALKGVHARTEDNQVRFRLPAKLDIGDYLIEPLHLAGTDTTAANDKVEAAPTAKAPVGPLLVRVKPAPFKGKKLSKEELRRIVAEKLKESQAKRAEEAAQGGQ
ncbi:MAG: hypothetical protein GC138_07305 [Gammaproteobacteria bacterium]|nr:hypothetical protein [Gammaproteobacteria bacterium]